MSKAAQVRKLVQVSKPAQLSKAIQLLLTLAVFLVSPGALAASLRTEISARQAVVGQTVIVQVTAAYKDGEPTPGRPDLKLVGKADVHGPSLRSQRSVRMDNFNFTSETSVVATWSITPTAAGKLIVGPATFAVGDEVLSGEQVVIQVLDGPLPGAQRPQRVPLFGSDPFDPFDALTGRGRQRGRRFTLPEAPKDLALAHAPNPIGFLYARVNKKRALVGEPITLEIFAYGSRGPFREMSPTEPSLADFLAYSAVESSHEQPSFRVDIDGIEFTVLKLRQLIIVPLKTGALEVGAMDAVLRGPNYPEQGSKFGMKVVSEPLTLDIIEPPMEGRPDGYQLGDVGKFSLAAQVTPTELTQNEYFSLVVTVKGSGNVPALVQLPNAPGLVFGDPVVRGKPDVQNGRLEGEITLEYTVQATESGAIDLGAVTLPFFDPSKRAYRTAQAKLPTLQVAPALVSPGAGPVANQAAASTPSAAEAPLVPRAQPTAFQQPAPPAPPFAWALLVAFPLAVALLLGLPRLLQGLSKRRIGRKSSRSSQHLADAKQSATDQGAPSEGGSTETLGHLERALYVSLEDSFGVRARGILKAHLSRELARAGLPEDLAQRVQALAESLDRARYEDTSQTPDGLLTTTEQLVRAIEKSAPTKRHLKDAP